MKMQEVTVLVPEERMAEFYEMFGRWLAGTDVVATSPLRSGPWTDSDGPLARSVWEKLSDRAQALFGALIDQPETKFSGERLASDLNIPNGKYGVAGVLAWPGRHCAAVGRTLPLKYEDGDAGANYWMSSEVADLFRQARDAK